MSEPNEKNNFVIEEYKILWSYYHKLLDERKKLFDWFLLIMTIPSSAIGFFVLNRDDNSDMPYSISSCVLFLIFLIGFALFLTYVKLSKNMDKYQSAKNVIRRSFNDKNETKEIKFLEEIKPRFPEPVRYLNLLAGVKFYRSLVFVLINSGVIAAAVQLYNLHSNYPSKLTVNTSNPIAQCKTLDSIGDERGLAYPKDIRCKEIGDKNKIKDGQRCKIKLKNQEVNNIHQTSKKLDFKLVIKTFLLSFLLHIIIYFSLNLKLYDMTIEDEKNKPDWIKPFKFTSKRFSSIKRKINIIKLLRKRNGKLKEENKELKNKLNS